jgi:hypothetical protein
LLCGGEGFEDTEAFGLEREERRHGPENLNILRKTAQAPPRSQLPKAFLEIVHDKM